MKNFRIHIILLIIFGFLYSIDVVYAQEQKNKKLELTLKGASELGLANNLDIQIAKYDAYVKQNDLYGAVSIFDTLLNMGASYEDDQLQKTSTILGTKSLTTDYNIDISKKLPTGTTIGLGFDHTRTWSNSAFASVNPAHESQAALSLSQQVGKNFFGLIDRSNVKITKLDIQNSDFTSLDKIETSLADIQKAYWQLVLAQEKVEIRKEMLDRATSLFTIHQNKLAIGLAEKPDLYAAEANKKTRENQLLRSRTDHFSAHNNLSLKLNYDIRDGLEFMPKEALSINGAQIPSFTESLSVAISNRRDYERALNDVESRKLQLVMKKNSLWPEIDLDASLIRNGVASQYKEAIEGVSDSDNPQYFFGITISYPLENSAARGEFKAAKLEQAKSLILLKQKERQIVVAIHDAVQALNTTYEAARTNYRIVELQAAKLAEEEKRFGAGRSNSDTLIRFHDDLLDAKLELIDSLYEYYSDLIDLRIEENSLLSEYAKNVL